MATIKVDVKLSQVLNSKAVLFGGYSVKGAIPKKANTATGDFTLIGHGGSCDFHVTNGVVDKVEEWK